ncbi:MAG: hypothetical protein WA957_04855 [Alteraurantiacibacter sp.]
MNPAPSPNRGGAFEKWTIRILIPALLLALFIAALGFAGVRGPDWRAWFDGSERGTWRAVEIDGLDVRQERMSIVVADGEIRGGRDGCNYWGYAGEPDPVTGERMMESTLAACIGTPAIKAYNTIGHYRAKIELLSENRLLVTYGETRGEFIRWTNDLAEAERAADEIAVQAAIKAQPPQPPQPPQLAPTVRPPPMPPTRLPPPAPVPPPPATGEAAAQDAGQTL